MFFNKEEINKKTINALIHPELVYAELQVIYKLRKNMLMIHDEMWKEVHDKRIDKTSEFYKIDDNLASYTDKINRLISMLLEMGNPMKESINLAIEVVDDEINRNQKIYEHRVEGREKVRKGLKNYIYTDGSITTNPNADNSYIEKKKKQIEDLKEIKIKLEDIKNKH